jgi:hypothetical protein
VAPDFVQTCKLSAEEKGTFDGVLHNASAADAILKDCGLKGGPISVSKSLESTRQVEQFPKA